MTNEIVGDVVIGIGVAIVVLGLVGLVRFKEFDLKLLAGAKIDTVGLIVIVLGAVVRSGVSWLSAKALLILAFVLIVNPVVTSTLAAGARRRRRGE
ncbi:cation:proton antiporter [Xylanimonas ulmi]|uniref:Multicomponent Na+:H+ antiporter subunit G n=1 Tax=Xylanimonas ulmi TaxID=228973 RepID=A0A4Q7M0U8_9MICO|nr:monovalent cation/H(+) antiporter subunit G [Xylanibacterium ulmi]RZS60821.1 multicomponent Na+:H+ antiporter subunit G [Xylanibacterium ulmi]